MSTIYDWSLTPGDNATADSDINWAEGMFPSSVNNSAREMMTRIAEYIKDNGVLDALGTNTIAVTSNSPITAITTGMTLSFRAANTNTGAVTLNVNGLGGKDIRKIVAGGTDSAPLAAGDINTKGIYLVHYDASTNAGAGAWVLINPIPPIPPVIPLPLAVASGGTGATDVAGARTNLGLGSMATQNSNAVAISGGNISGVSSVTTIGQVTAVQDFQSSTSIAAIGPTGAGTVALRPNGVNSATGQALLNSAGTFSAPTLQAAGQVSAGNGSSVLGTDGNVFGSIWLTFGGGLNDAFGAINARIESRASAYAAIGRGVGVGQTWQPFSLSNNTWTTNATGQPIMVAVLGGSGCDIFIGVNNDTGAPARVASSPSGTAVAAVIPAGAVFKYIASGSGFAGWILQ